MSEMNNRKLFLSLAEALTIYGLIILGYGVLAIHITQTGPGIGLSRHKPSMAYLRHFYDD